MHFHPFETSIPHIAYTCLGGFVVFFGMFSLFIREKLYIGEACWAFLFGVIIGPYGANIFNPRGWGNGSDAVMNEITLEFTRVVLAIGVFAIGVELPKAYMRRHWKSIFFLLLPVMTWGWFVSAGLIFAIIPKLSFLSSLAVAACLTPTDPILAAAVIGGRFADKHVPAHLRHLLAAESGCNDGAAFPFLYIALYLTIDRTTSEAVEDWFVILWLYQVLLGIVWGSMLGFGFRHLMKFCEAHNLIDRQSYVAQYISLALLTTGSCALLGSDDLLAAFACGTAFAWDGFFNKQTEASVFSSVIDLLFNIAAFVYVGAWTPFDDFNDPALSLTPWRLVVIAILVLLLRRIPPVLALYRWIPDIKNIREALFSGHFGPMGVGAIFISTLATRQLPPPHDPPETQAELLGASIEPIVAFMVVTSILIHGLSIPFFSLGRRVHTFSRTWSRRETPAVPEWTTQTRPVLRGTDIVINRDEADRAERGERSPEGIEKESLPSREGESEATTTAGPSPEGSHEEPLEEALPDNVPNGTETFMEWREGPNRIIERRHGPGEEVEVEVQRNAFGPSDAERASHAFRGEPEQARSAARAFIETLKHAPEEVEHVVELAEHAVEEAGAKLERKLSATQRREHPHEHEPQDATASTSAAAAAAAPHEEEEGWASDQSAAEERGKKRRWGRKKPTVFGRAGRRRAPLPRAGIARAQAGHVPPPAITTGARLPPTQGAPSPVRPSPSDEGARGRVAETGALRRRERPRHLRLQSLLVRGETPSVREASPARSVRFADEEPQSGWTTPHGPLSTPGSAMPSDDESEGELEYEGPAEGEPSGARVTFDLPDDRARDSR